MDKVVRQTENLITDDMLCIVEKEYDEGESTEGPYDLSPYQGTVSDGSAVMMRSNIMR